MATTIFDPSEGPSEEQQQAELSALEQGEKILEAQAADEAAKWNKVDAENENLSLIGGKFKSQDDLLKAYEELQRKMSSGEKTEETEEAPEATETTEETTEEETEYVAPEALAKAAEEYEKGSLSEETLDTLSKMDSRELIESYIKFYSQSQAKVQQQSINEAQVSDIKKMAGGEEGYASMLNWASSNLSSDEINAFNSVANSGNYPALRFAVEALNNRYKAAEGYEAPLVTGRRPAPAKDTFRSHAELARAIADPRYHNDPAYRADVEAKLQNSPDLI